MHPQKWEPLTETDSDELYDVLLYEIQRHNLEYADTFRCTPANKDIEEHLEKQSCCGVFEMLHVCFQSGHKYYLGCNYGH